MLNTRARGAAASRGSSPARGREVLSRNVRTSLCECSRGHDGRRGRRAGGRAGPLHVPLLRVDRRAACAGLVACRSRSAGGCPRQRFGRPRGSRSCSRELQPLRRSAARDEWDPPCRRPPDARDQPISTRIRQASSGLGMGPRKEPTIHTSHPLHGVDYEADVRVEVHGPEEQEQDSGYHPQDPDDARDLRRVTTRGERLQRQREQHRANADKSEEA